jgi:cytochrome d ubiquinol oxidase subunit II
MIVERSRKSIFANALPFLIFFLYFAITLLIQPGYAYDSETGIVSMESFKYLHNFLAMPIVAALFLIGVVAVLGGIVWGMMDNNRYSFWATAGGTVFTVLALFLVAGLNNTSFYPSNFDLQSSLTIENSSSSKYTLTVMSYVSLLVPFVVAYIYYVWRSMGKKRSIMLAQVIYLLSWPALIIAAWIISWQVIKYWEKRFDCHTEEKN